MAQVDGEILIADAGGGGLRLDPATLALLGETGPADAPRLARARGDLSPDGSFRAPLPVVEDPGLVMTRASDGAPLWEDPAITARAFAPDGKSIACGRSLSIGGLQRRMIESGVRISTCAPYSSQSNSGRLTAVAFSPDGRIAGADADGVVMMFQKDESREFGNACYTLRRRVSGLVWHPDGTRIAVGLGGDSGTILLLGGKDAVYFCGHYSDVRALWFTPDGTRLVSAGTDGQCFVWDVPAS
jgi:WD40 repeat protein